MPLHVLLTNPRLSQRTGAELYVSDIATALLHRGHRPIVYAPVLGPLAHELRAAPVPVVDDLSAIATRPDIIHGQQNHDLMTALLHFPGVPAVRLCHGWDGQRPQRFPRIFRFVAVDDTVRDRLVCEWGVPEADVDVVLNFADMARFRPRPPLPVRPARALVFSNDAALHLGVVRRACARQGIDVDAAGLSVGAVAQRPERILGRYDVVFAKARCAIEALASGTAVVLCDQAGVGPLVTIANVDELRLLNFGWRTLRCALGVEPILRELSKYDADDAAQVTRKIRSTAGLDDTLNALVRIYEEVIRESLESKPVDLGDELRAAAAYVQALGPMLEEYSSLRGSVYRLLKQMYFRCEQVRIVQRLLPSRLRARRLAKGLRRF